MQSVAEPLTMLYPLVDLRKKFDEANHPRQPSGSDKGGEFAPKNGTTVGSDAKAPEGKLTKRPPAIKVKSLKEAVDLILKGKVVELDDAKDVHTVLKKLAKIGEEAVAKGKKAPTYDLCNVTVPGTNLFCTEGLKTKEHPHGIPRIAMPQLKGEPLPGSKASKLPLDKKGRVDATDLFLDHLKELGIEFDEGKTNTNQLRASQSQLDGPKVAEMMGTIKPKKSTIFVSRDNYIVDGHHHWAAAVAKDAKDGKLGDVKIGTITIDAPIAEILLIAKQFTKKLGIAGRSVAKSEWTRALKGAGKIHSDKWHRCWEKVQGKGHDSNAAAAICTSSIGYRGSINKEHRQQSKNYQSPPIAGRTRGPGIRKRRLSL